MRMMTMTAILAAMLSTTAMACGSEDHCGHQERSTGVIAADNSGNRYDLGTRAGREGYAKARRQETIKSMYFYGGKEMVNSYFGEGTIRDDPGGAPNTGYAGDGK